MNVHDFFQASLRLMGKTIRIGTEFEDIKDLKQADDMLSQIIELLSKDYILNSELEYRKAFFEFCRDVATRNT